MALPEYQAHSMEAPKRSSRKKPTPSHPLWKTEICKHFEDPEQCRWYMSPDGCGFVHKGEEMRQKPPPPPNEAAPSIPLPAGDLVARIMALDKSLAKQHGATGSALPSLKSDEFPALPRVPLPQAAPPASGATAPRSQDASMPNATAPWSKRAPLTTKATTASTATTSTPQPTQPTSQPTVSSVPPPPARTTPKVPSQPLISNTKKVPITTPRSAVQTAPSSCTATAPVMPKAGWGRTVAPEPKPTSVNPVSHTATQDTPVAPPTEIAPSSPQATHTVDSCNHLTPPSTRDLEQNSDHSLPRASRPLSGGVSVSSFFNIAWYPEHLVPHSSFTDATAKTIKIVVATGQPNQ